MTKAEVYQGQLPAGILEELENHKYRFTYAENYAGPPVSLVMPTIRQSYEFDSFPPVFDGLLPEGIQLEAMLRRHKLDKKDFFGQLMVAGADMVGALTFKEIA